ncbi:MAG: dTDP-glucose 4,6-dehydratase [Desulfurococcales archaeon]|nr:dTDP-glucose 4,6-dehydratase [Desulfurococcales archaeon]
MGGRPGRLLVVGGAGFIGSNFVRHELVEAGAGDVEVLVYDKLTYAGRLENLHDVRGLGGFRFVRGDVCDEGLLERVVGEFEPDAVVNFAAETHVDRSINEPAPFIRTNVLGVFTLLEVLRRLGGDTVYLHVSTDEVYGDLWGVEGEADESWPLNPSSPYSASKASADLLVRAYGRTYGIRYRIARPCNNYGPYQHPEKLIPRTIVRLLLGRPATIYGDGGQVRDWLYVGDTVRAFDAILRRGGDFEVYNICAHQYATVKSVVEAIVRLMGRDPSRDIVYVEGRPGEDRRYAMKCDKIAGLGWRPRVSLEEGLRATVEWYTGNRWWWEPLVDERYVLAEKPWRPGGGP